MATLLILTTLVWFNRGALLTLWDLVRDRQALVACVDGLGLFGPLILMGLVGLQVLIPTLPAEPPMIASGYVYGFTTGFLMNWSVAVAVSQAVFYLARYTGRPIVERIVPAKLLDKWMPIVGERGTVLFILAFVIPPIPNDILIYVAGLTSFSGRRFFVANLIGRAPIVTLLTLVGTNGLSITPAIIIGLCLLGLLMLVAWWAMFVCKRSEVWAWSSESSVLQDPMLCLDVLPALNPTPESMLRTLTFQYLN
jgi:uncharacterized membrane protein YdjX (TVP38/TMEM64 family)